MVKTVPRLQGLVFDEKVRKQLKNLMTMVHEKEPMSVESQVQNVLEVPTDDVATEAIGTLESVIFLPSPAVTETEVITI